MERLSVKVTDEDVTTIQGWLKEFEHGEVNPFNLIMRGINLGGQKAMQPEQAVPVRSAEVAAGMDWLHNRVHSAANSIYDEAKEEHALLGYIKQLEAPHSFDITFPGLHYHTAQLVRRFAAALGDKLLKAQEKYDRSTDWMETNWQTECQTKLVEHVAKGDPLDVSAYAAFLWHHRWSSAATPGDTSGAQLRGVPWSDCKVAYSIEDDEALWAALPIGVEGILPKGWELVETDFAGARAMAVFRVDGIPNPVDGETVQKFLAEHARLPANPEESVG